MVVRYVVVASSLDPVATGVRAVWGHLPSSGDHVDGVPLRELRPGVLLWERPVRHIHDDGLDLRLPAAVRADRPALVFPSIHASESGEPCLTVHPLGNPGPSAEVGGEPRMLVPTSPRLMTDALRRLDEAEGETGMRATFEATHHGPLVGLPAFFVEIGFAPLASPPTAAVQALARAIPELTEDPTDRVVIGVGGGHYAPHFTQLAIRRRWAFGHLLSRHALGTLDASTAQAIVSATPGVEGALYARASDATLEVARWLPARLGENTAPRRAPTRSDASRPRIDASPSSGT